MEFQREGRRIRVPYFDDLSPTTQQWTRRALGIGIGLYVGHVVITSPEVKGLVRAFWAWKNYSPPPAPKVGCVDADQFLKTMEEGHPEPEGIWKLGPEDRLTLWHYMTRTDLKTVRLVCKTFNLDVDHVFGLYVNLDCRNVDQLRWIRTKVIQGCSLYFFESLTTWKFVSNPNALNEFTINSTNISPTHLRAMLSTFLNLRKVVVYFKDHGNDSWRENLWILKCMGEMRSRVDELAVESVTQVESCKWTMKFRGLQAPGNRSAVKEIPCPKHLHLALDHYAGPRTMENAQTRYFWQRLLCHQDRLETVYSNVGPADWAWYSRVLVKNGQSLCKVGIRNIASWEAPDAKLNPDASFDWNIFRNTPKLVSLTLLATEEKRNGPMLVKPLRFGALNLQSLKLDFGYVHWSFYDSIINASAPTLTSLTLSRIVELNLATGRENMFDWAMLRKCQKLESLSLSALEFQFMMHKNFQDIPGSIRNLDLFWFSFNTHHLYFLAKHLRGFDPQPHFMQMCQVKGVAADSCPQEYIKMWRHEKTPLEKVMDLYNELPLPIFHTLITAYLILC